MYFLKIISHYVLYYVFKSHAFHSRCVGKWLSERHAVCPLCKEDLYVEEEEEAEDEGDPIATMPQDDFASTFWSRINQSLAATRDTPTETMTIGNVSQALEQSENQPAEEVRNIQPPLWRRVFRRPWTTFERETEDMITQPLLPTTDQQPYDEESPIVLDPQFGPTMIPLEENGNLAVEQEERTAQQPSGNIQDGCTTPASSDEINARQITI